MKPRIIRWLALSFALCLVLAVAFGSSSVAKAQQIATVEYGTSVVGRINTDGEQIAYSFAGNAGDLVTARVVGITPGMDPNLTLFGPLQEVLTTIDNIPTFPAANDALIVYRLLVPGTYTLVVSGTPGDFLLTLEVRPQVVTTVLIPQEPAVIRLPLDPVDQVFAFNTDPFLATTLLIDSEPFFLDATIQVRDSTGQVTASLSGDLDNACLSFGPGDDLHEVTVIGTAEAVGDITFTLSNAPCVFGPEPVQIDFTTIPFQPIPLPNVCAASSFVNVNIRSGPGLNFPVITLLPRGRAIPIVGISQEGDWYAVQGETFLGWVSARVTFVVGPCTALPLVQAPAPPAQPPTPGLPLLSPTPAVTIITGTPGPTQTPAVTVITATPVPGVTATATVAIATTEPPDTPVVVPTTEVPPATATSVPLTPAAATPTVTPTFTLTPAA